MLADYLLSDLRPGSPSWKVALYRPAMRARTRVLLAALVTTLSCSRPEEPLGVPAATSAGHQGASRSESNGTAGSSTAARCLIPTPETPAPAAAPAATCPADPAGPPTLPRAAVVFIDAPGAPEVNVELAQTEAQRSRGLMYRTSMPDSGGMLFSWADERVRSFWMHNTCLPLDMLFIAADGFITGILEQVPTLNDDARSIPCPAAHVLEVNAGYTRARGIKAGQRIRIRM